ncbi:kelch-like protein 20 [Branchiostoma lanceolatum]|uniref:KLHL5 protein n=1 Tax=Branchiostoma lanceolatum TaxID=7740 RepID=A0A8K0A077_BRALA|nr:KLHL5 [Branchiostoma lanceolatum]
MDFDKIEQTTGKADFVVHEAEKRFANKALVTMNTLRRSGQLCDVEISVEGKTLHAHKVVLASFSNYFYAMFTGDLAEASQGSITMKGVDPRSLELLIEYAYTGRLEIHVDTVQGLLYASSLLQLPDVQQSCSTFLKKQLHPANCLGIRNFADAHTCHDLLAASEQFAQRHFTQVIEEEEFLMLPKAQLTELIASEDLHVSNEEEVFNAIISWAYHDRENRKHHIAELLKQVRLPLLSPHFLVDTVEHEDLIKQDLACRDLLDEAKNYHMLPDRRGRIKRDRIRPRRSCVGVIYCCGGMDTTGHSLSSVERFDLSSGKVSIVASMNTPRSGVGVAVLEGQVYAVGGHDGSQYLNTVECYNPTERRWKYVAPMCTARRYVAVGVMGGLLYAVGGYDGSAVLDCVEVYDPKSDHWRYAAPMHCKRRHVAVGVLEGRMYAVGGHDGASYLKSVERYDPETSQWSMTASMSARRGGVGVATLSGKLYAMGGYDGKSNLSTLERYYAAEDRWSSVAPMNMCRSGAGIGVLGECLYALGGHDGAHYLNTVEMFDPRVGEWKIVGNMGTCRAVAGVAVLHDCYDTTV